MLRVICSRILKPKGGWRTKALPQVIRTGMGHMRTRKQWEMDSKLKRLKNVLSDKSVVGHHTTTQAHKRLASGNHVYHAPYVDDEGTMRYADEAKEHSRLGYKIRKHLLRANFGVLLPEDTRRAIRRNVEMYKSARQADKNHALQSELITADYVVRAKDRPEDGYTPAVKTTKEHKRDVLIQLDNVFDKLVDECVDVAIADDADVDDPINGRFRVTIANDRVIKQAAKQHFIIGDAKHRHRLDDLLTTEQQTKVIDNVLAPMMDHYGPAAVRNMQVTGKYDEKSVKRLVKSRYQYALNILDSRRDTSDVAVATTATQTGTTCEVGCGGEDVLTPRRRFKVCKRRDYKAYRQHDCIYANEKLTYLLKGKYFMKARDAATLHQMVSDARVLMIKAGKSLDCEADYEELTRCVMAAYLVDEAELEFRQRLKNTDVQDAMAHHNAAVRGDLGKIRASEKAPEGSWYRNYLPSLALDPPKV